MPGFLNLYFYFLRVQIFAALWEIVQKPLMSWATYETENTVSCETAELLILLRRVLVLSVGFPRQTMVRLGQIMFYFFICSQCGLYLFLGSAALYILTCADVE